MPTPTRTEVHTHFTLMSQGKYDEFFTWFSPDVKWTVMGTSPMSRTYTSLSDFREATLVRLSKIFKDPGLLIKVRNVIGGGPDQEWVSVELGANAECVDGQPYGMTYNWVCRFDESSGKIVEVRAYIDTALLTKALRDNECPVFTTPTGM